MKNGKGMSQWSVEKRILKTERTAGATSKTELQTVKEIEGIEETEFNMAWKTRAKRWCGTSKTKRNVVNCWSVNFIPNQSN